jgi:uncharacterized protein YbjT (DUF2867 family)
MIVQDNQSMTVLVIGATGRHGGTGGRVVERMLDAGHAVRALVRSSDERAAKLRHSGVRTFNGDALDRRTLIPALEGVDAIYVAYPVRHGIAEALLNVASVIAEQGASPHVVVMSMGAADHNSPSAIARGHALAEETLLDLGVNLTAVRGSAFFYENLTALHAHQIATTGVLSNCYGSSHPAWVSGTDIADVCAHVLLDPQHYSGTPIIYPPGHEQLSQHDIADIISEETGRDVSYQYIPAGQWRRELEALGFLPTSTVEHLTEMARMCEDGTTLLRQDADPSALQAASGRPPLTFRNFIKENRTAFQPFTATA